MRGFTKMQYNIQEVQTGIERYLNEYGGIMDDELGILPSHHSRKLRDASLYQNHDLVRQTASTLLPIARESLKGLQAKIEEEQAEAKENAIQASYDVAEGKGNIRLNIRLNGLRDPIGEIRRAYKQFGSEEHREQIRNSEEFSIGLGDMYRRIALTAVVSGLEIMAETGEIIPEVVGRAFHETYNRSLC